MNWILPFHIYTCGFLLLCTKCILSFHRHDCEVCFAKIWRKFVSHWSGFCHHILRPCFSASEKERRRRKLFPSERTYLVALSGSMHIYVLEEEEEEEIYTLLLRTIHINNIIFYVSSNRNVSGDPQSFMSVWLWSVFLVRRIWKKRGKRRRRTKRRRRWWSENKNTYTWEQTEHQWKQVRWKTNHIKLCLNTLYKESTTNRSKLKRKLLNLFTKRKQRSKLCTMHFVQMTLSSIYKT